MVLYPELKRMGKKIVIGSYSFGDPNKISGPVVYADTDDPTGRAIVKRCTAACKADLYYAPEFHMYTNVCSEYSIYEDAHGLTTLILKMLHTLFMHTMQGLGQCQH